MTTQAQMLRELVSLIKTVTDEKLVKESVDRSAYARYCFACKVNHPGGIEVCLTDQEQTH